MIPYEQALELVLGTARPLGVERVPVDRAAGRVLGEDIVSAVDSPPFDKAAMDGFAVRAADVRELPACLELVGESRAGSLPDFRVGPGQAARISTGAPVPSGADMVVMVEHTRQAGQGRVVIKAVGERNICRRGEDVRRGETVLRAGTRLGPLEVGVAAGAGQPMPAVHRLPRVALLCTGTEVVEPGRGVAPGRIYNSNGPMLSALLEPLAEEFTYLGVVGDEPQALRAALRRGLEAELFLISGGVSMGRHDLVPEALEELGVRRVFHKCAIKPGKPTWFGARGERLVFGLPGNPFSCFVVFHALVLPALRRLTGLGDAAPPFGSGVVEEGFENRAGRLHFVPCALRVDAGVVRLRRRATHGSADIVNAAPCDALLMVPAECPRVEAGALLRYLPVSAHG